MMEFRDRYGTNDEIRFTLAGYEVKNFILNAGTAFWVIFVWLFCSLMALILKMFKFQ